MQNGTKPYVKRRSKILSFPWKGNVQLYTPLCEGGWGEKGGGGTHEFENCGDWYRQKSKKMYSLLFCHASESTNYRDNTVLRLNQRAEFIHG
jgi:hypothetical protein